MSEIVSTVGGAELFRNVIVAVILVPIVWHLIRRQDKVIEDSNRVMKEGFTALSKTFDDGVKRISTALLEHERSDVAQLEKIDVAIISATTEMKRGINSLMKSLGNTYLDQKQTVDIFKSKMWLVSHGKLEYLRSVILANHFKGREEQIFRAIRSELARQSQEYMRDFESYSTPVGLLSDWLKESFNEKDFNDFVSEVAKIVMSDSYSEHERIAACELKLKDVSNLMKQLQNELALQLEKDCSEEASI